MDEHQDLQIMRSRVRLVFVALLSVTTGKPISSPQPDDTMDFSDMWSSDGGLFAEPAASLDSSVFLALNPVSSDAGWDYSMFSDGDGDISASVLDSDEANASNIDVSCISDSDVGSPSDLDILKSRDSLDETWTSFEPSTEKKVCPINREPQPPQQSPLQLPSLDQYDVTDECPPLPDGRQRHALCCYDPDVREPSGDIVAKNCWRCQYIIIPFKLFYFLKRNLMIHCIKTYRPVNLYSEILRRSYLGL